MKPTLLAALVALTLPAAAQNGDKPGENQQLPVPRELIPPAPPLSPEEALKRLRLPPGLRAELVAAEPLVHTPVAVTWDADGRLWVCEMRGYMQDFEAASEQTPDGEIAVLEDTDGDGRMDRRTTFLGGLVMPRALAVLPAGVLVAEPPNLWFCRDTDGDLKCDDKQLVSDSYGNQKNPEHNANGLLPALDNWIYSANHTNRHRLAGGQWRTGPAIFRGQWGLTQDDTGRLIYNSNSDWLRGDLVPAEALLRNPSLNRPFGGNVQFAKDQSVWPSRVTPGINRGYQKPMLRDGRLAIFTAACGPGVYRGDALPAEFRGQVFVCEPSGNLVRRAVLSEDADGVVTGRNAHERDEFLTSTDERFRPVNTYTGPDGALYVVDMARGLIQHRIYLTTFLRNQIEERELLAPVDRGRIYRIVPDGWKPGATPHLARATVAELIAALSHANGWWRDTAQQQLVARGGGTAVEPLRELAGRPGAGLAAVHALWSLEGLGALDAGTVRRSLASADRGLRQQALRAAAGLPPQELAALRRDIDAAAADPDSRVRREAVFTAAATPGGPPLEFAAAALERDSPLPLTRDAVFSGLSGRELELIEALLTGPAWQQEAPGRAEALAALARCVVAEGHGQRVGRLLEGVASAAAWPRAALIAGLAGLVPATPPSQTPPKIIPVKLSHPPRLFAGAATNAGPTAGQLQRAASLFTWPGKPGAASETEAASLSAEEQQRFEAGRELYSVICGACHQPNGKGQDGLAPPLLGTDWVLGSPERLVGIVLHGLRGPIEINGQHWEMEMPGLNLLEDEEIAAVLTYIRREWGHSAAPVGPETVARVRAASAERTDPWTVKDLQAQPWLPDRVP
ncbi:MAG: c-type cytochrome [Limisphaerales bacterium]